MEKDPRLTHQGKGITINKTIVADSIPEALKEMEQFLTGKAAQLPHPCWKIVLSVNGWVETGFYPTDPIGD